MSRKKLNHDLLNNEIKEFKNADKNQQLEKIKQMKNELAKSMKQKEEQEDPDNILYQNIDRANRFLDILENEITEKDPQTGKGKNKSISRLFEVSAQLINAITSATQSIAGSYKDDMEYQYKLELLELKNKELMIKHALGGQGGGSNTTNNLIVSSREELLDIINNRNTDNAE